LFDPSTETWTTTGNMHHIRGWHTASLLPNGKVLVSGGSVCSVYDNGINNAELYDPVTGTWVITNSMQFSRSTHTASTLANGNVLVVGTWNGSSATRATELYNSTAGSYIPANQI
jgi:hypothetical protein